MKNSLIATVGIVIVLLTVIPGAVQEANGGTYNATKTVTWVSTASKAYYDYYYHVFAEDKHNIGRHHQDNLLMTDGSVPVDVADRLVSPTIFMGAVTKSPHCRWDGKIAIPTAGPSLLPIGPINISSMHPTSTANVTISSPGLATIPTPPPPGPWGPTQFTANINVSGSAAVTAIPSSHAPETAFADSSAGGYVEIWGWLSSVSVVGGKVAVSAPLGFTTSVGLTASTDDSSAAGYVSKTTYSDPIHLSILDEETQEIIAENDLLNENWLVQGNASAEWGDDGLVLQVYDSHSNASAVFETLSDWVLNPFNGTASITDGIFSATGDLANLGWEITVDGDKTTATLPLSELGQEFNFDILPDGLGTPEHNLLTKLDMPSIPYTDDYKTIDVPEPATLALLGLGGLALLRRRRV